MSSETDHAHNRDEDPSRDEAVAHCLDKLVTLIGDDEGGRRVVFQLGYNLGRLSELASLGREPCWDAFKGPVDDWDRQALADAVRLLKDRLRDRT